VLDLSFYRRGDLATRPIIIKDARNIWTKTQDIATLGAVAFFSGLIVWLVFR